MMKEGKEGRMMKEGEGTTEERKVKEGGTHQSPRAPGRARKEGTYSRCRLKEGKEGKGGREEGRKGVKEVKEDREEGRKGVKEVKERRKGGEGRG